MKSVILFFLFFCQSAYAYVDLNLSYTFSMRQVDGIETDANPDPGSAKTTSSGYVLNWAWFVWEYTALELNYSQTTQKMVDDRELATDDDSIIIKQRDSTVITQVSGVGIRQAFASRKSRIIPSLAIGYAKYTTSGTSKITLDNAGTEVELEDEQDTQESSSSYATFSIRFRFTQLMGLTLAAKTVMPDFDTSEAGNNVTYSAGLSWVF